MTGARPFAVIGHAGWMDMVQVDHLPACGEDIDVQLITQVVAGGGANVAVQLAHIAGHATLFTALGNDELGHRALEELEKRRVDVHVAWRDAPTRRDLTLIHSSDGERTTFHTPPLLEPDGGDPLPWHLLDAAAAVYFTAGDLAALQHARRSRRLVISPRPRCLSTADVLADAVIFSAADGPELEAVQRMRRTPRIRIETSGASGGRYWTADSSGSFAAAPLPAPPVDTYGCGDAFAAAVTYGLGCALPIALVLDLAARRGADCVTRRGPYPGKERPVTVG